MLAPFPCFACSRGLFGLCSSLSLVYYSTVEKRTKTFFRSLESFGEIYVPGLYDLALPSRRAVYLHLLRFFFRLFIIRPFLSQLSTTAAAARRRVHTMLARCLSRSQMYCRLAPCRQEEQARTINESSARLCASALARVRTRTYSK